MTFVQRLSALPPGVKLALMFLADAVFLPLCAVAAVALRLGSFEGATGGSLAFQLGLGLCTLPVLAAAGLYRAVVRFIDLRVLTHASLALGAAVLMVYGAAHLADLGTLPRSALLVFWFVAFTYVVSSRFLARAILRGTLRRRSGRTQQRAAIYGAGAAGAQLARAMQFSPDHRAVCFFDDDARLQGKTVGGLKVYPPDAAREAAEQFELTQIVLAVPSASMVRKRELIRRVEHAGLPVKILPGIVSLVDGHADVSEIREVDVADLLGRDPVPPQPELFGRNITGKVVLVTGAGGSIGSELCRQILSQHPLRLVMLDHSEFALYNIEHELKPVAAGTELVARLGSVLDESALLDTLRDHGVQTIYHAAAYKHVPIVESNARQGVLNNVFGTLAVSRAALACGVQTCVLISTDKAVRPTNVMGASKRIAELVFQAAALRADGRTVFSMVRFGNVLGSSGSVVPLFKRQIQAGGPITVTHPDIIRFFMLIPEAAQLVIQAGAMARGGEVFVLDMGEPVRIADLARSMIRLCGLTEKSPRHPDGDIELKFVGLRPGEKLFEELLIGDATRPSGHPRIMAAMERSVEPVLLDKMLASLRKACDQSDDEAVLRQVRNLVPEYRTPEEVNGNVPAGEAPPPAFLSTLS
jgi:FlaA1/EpsC-like NDP-sugar epimerase